MDSKILRNRIRAIRRGLDKAKISCLIVTKAANVTYTTGFLGDDNWTVITPRGVYLLTDSRYTEQAQKECPACRIIERKWPIAEAAAKLIKRLKSVRTAYVEKSTSVEVFEVLKKHLKRRIKTVGNIIENVRTVKGNDEVAAIRTAGRIAAKALKAAIKYAVSGISENELAGRLDFEIRRLGATNGFETIVAFGSNASRPHHQPGKKKLKNKDAVLIDFGARYKSYCCDITRCFTVGRADKFYQKVYKAVEEADNS
ncbi:M24 family metallopeptidase [Planctomycetota bacterium]